MKELKFSFVSFLLGIKWTIFYILGYYLMIYILFGDFEIFKMWYSYIWPLIISLPDIYVIAGYLVEDFNKKIIVGNNYIIDQKTRQKYDSNEILKIVIHKPKNSYAFASYLYYKFVEIKLKNKDKIIVTSLVKSDIDEYLKKKLNGVYFDRDFNNFL